MPIISIKIDHLPYKELSPNARVHWRTRHKFTQSAKAEVYYLAQEKLDHWKAPKKAMISYVFTVTSYHNRDLDNLLASCKAFQDGLVQAGILRADDGWQFSIGKGEVVKGTREQTEIRICDI